MIVRTFIDLDGQALTHTKSDSGFMIRKSGTEEIYIDALDVLDFEYEETDIPILTLAE